MPVTDFKIVNKSMPVATTEYKWDIPANTERFSMQLRDFSKTFKLGVEVGEIAAGRYVSFRADTVLNENDLRLIGNAKTLYFSSPDAAQIMEILVFEGTPRRS